MKSHANTYKWVIICSLAILGFICLTETAQADSFLGQRAIRSGLLLHASLRHSQAQGKNNTKRRELRMQEHKMPLYNTPDIRYVDPLSTLQNGLMIGGSILAGIMYLVSFFYSIESAGPLAQYGIYPDGFSLSLLPFYGAFHASGMGAGFGKPGIWLALGIIQVVGLAAMITSIVLYATSKNRMKPEKHASLQVNPWLSTKGGGVALSGRF